MLKLSSAVQRAGQPLVLAHCATSPCPSSSAFLQVRQSQGHPWYRSHWRTNRWPPAAALLQASSSHSHLIVRLSLCFLRFRLTTTSIFGGVPLLWWGHLFSMLLSLLLLLMLLSLLLLLFCFCCGYCYCRFRYSCCCCRY